MVDWDTVIQNMQCVGFLKLATSDQSKSCV